MLSLDEGKKAVDYAKKVIEEYVKNKKIPKSNLCGIFSEKQGAFVTIHTFPNHDLRGCIGIPLPIMPLFEAIAEGASSATNDPRFPPLSIYELDKIIIEVTVLSPPEIIQVEKPEDYLKKIIIGRHGLIVEQGFYKGLLLPQVPIEQEWNVEEFLNNTCMKAGLMPDAWFDKQTRVSRFSGQVFTETTPNGDIKEKKLDGESC